METSKVAVALSPVPGFCVKSTATRDTSLRLAVSDSDPPLHVDKGLKVFVNFAWDPSVPAPPPAADDAIQLAIQALDTDNANAWFVPIVLSDARLDSDKAGKPAIVIDCVFHPSIKSRSLRDLAFKDFIIELAFQRIEAQTTLHLSRHIGTPNIASKGKPRSRRVLVPTALFPPGHPHRQVPPTLVQEIPDRHASVPDTASLKRKFLAPASESEPRLPAWSWSQQGSSIRIVFDVPGVTRAIIPECTLDVEPRRILLHVPALYNLDINLDYPDSELFSLFGKGDTATAALNLKRARCLDVDAARAEWRVADNAIILLA